MGSNDTNLYWECGICHEINPAELQRSCKNCYGGRPPGAELLTLTEAERRKRGETGGVQEPLWRPPEEATSQEPSDKTAAFFLQVTAGAGPVGQTFPIVSGNNVLGRAPQEAGANNICLDQWDPANRISGAHLTVVCRDLKIDAFDMGSTNGTVLNQAGMEKGKRYPLRPGDRIRLGGLVLKVGVAKT